MNNKKRIEAMNTRINGLAKGAAIAFGIKTAIDIAHGVITVKNTLDINRLNRLAAGVPAEEDIKKFDEIAAKWRNKTGTDNNNTAAPVVDEEAALAPAAPAPAPAAPAPAPAAPAPAAPAAPASAPAAPAPAAPAAPASAPAAPAPAAPAAPQNQNQNQQNQNQNQQNQNQNQQNS